MGDIQRDSDVNELDGPPRFGYGEKVRSRKVVRNDGTFPGKDIGEVLVKKGEIGYVSSIGTFLQRFYIYGVDFPERGYRVGMKAKELESLDHPQSTAKPLVEAEGGRIP
ncbi:MAG TPA: nitrogen fixation protein NifZ [Methylococcus sp.]|nr:nitrogen fixation protein NifZ [Methylococcus sp.]